MLLEALVGYGLVGLLTLVVMLTQHKFSGEKLAWDWYDYFTLCFVVAAWPWVLWVCYKAHTDELDWENGNG